MVRLGISMRFATTTIDDPVLVCQDFLIKKQENKNG